MSQRSDVTLKLLALVCVVFVVLALVLMHQSPATGYELSIYSGTPLSVWGLLFLSLVGGIGIVVHELATGRHEGSWTYLVGFAVILLTAVAFLCLPFIRNYYTWRGDQMGHIGFVMDIATKGHVPGFNPYPISHTLLLEISTVTNTPIPLVVNLNTALIFAIFIMTTYLLATAVLPNRGQQLLAPLIAVGTLAGLSRFNLVPNTWSILLLPLFFYCYFKRDEPPFKILLVLLLMAYPFIHPLSALMIIVALAMIEFPKPIYAWLLRRFHVEAPSWMAKGPVVWPVALELLIFLPWVFTREAFRTNVNALWWQLQNFSGSRQGADVAEKLSKVHLDAFGIVMIVLKLYGEILIFCVLACLGILFVARQLRSDENHDSKFRLLYVGLLFVIATLAYFAFYAGAPGAEAISAPRLLVYVEVASIPLIAFALWELCSRARRKRLAWGAVSGLLVLAAFLNVAGHHAAPYQIRPGEQITQADMDGMTWFLKEKDPDIHILYIMSSPDRFSQAILGSTVTFSRRDVRYVDQSQLPDHFGYLPPEEADKSGESETYTTMGEQYVYDIYANINKFDKIAYQTVWKSLNRFNDADFKMIEKDPTVNRIYSDGATDCLYITGHKQET